jgi:hypothetical protein
MGNRTDRLISPTHGYCLHRPWWWKLSRSPRLWFLTQYWHVWSSEKNFAMWNNMRTKAVKHRPCCWQFCLGDTVHDSILNSVCRDGPQSLEANAGIIPEKRPQPIPSTIFQFNEHLNWIYGTSETVTKVGYWNFAASHLSCWQYRDARRRCEISSGKSSSILRIAPTLLQATSICSALLNIIFRLNIFPTMKL